MQQRPSKRSKRRGLITLWVCVTLLLLLAFVGYASDAGWVYLTGHQLQNAADAGALAGALQVQTNTATAVTRATNVAQLNKAGGALVQLAANPSNASTGDVVIGFYDRSSGTFTATLSSPNAIKVQTRRTSTAPGGALPLHFATLAGFSSSNITRYAIAMIGGTINSGLVVLNKTASPAISLTGTGSNSDKIVVNNGAVVVDSTSASAISASGHPDISASALYVSGNDTGLVGSSIFPSGHLGINSPYTPDPLASLPAPAKPAAGVVSGSNLGQGYYPSGFPSKGGVLTGGLYYVDGGISLSGNGSLTVTAGSTIYLHTGGLSMKGNSSISITPPTTGTYAGISLFEDRANSSAISLGGTPASTSGTFYAPAAAVSLQGNASTYCTQLICDTLSIGGNAQLTLNYNGQFPVSGHEVFLVK